jgi:trehalose 6-phosphate synthase
MFQSGEDSNPGTIVVVSNRLPVSLVRNGRKRAWESSPGGLVSALRPILRGRRSVWIGWSGGSEAIDPFEADAIRNVPLALSADEVKSFYEGFSNRVLWPLYHDAIRKPEFSREWWHSYVEVNRRFAEAAVEAAREDGFIWVHDYHLQLVPGMVRERLPDARIGFFLHIPFPPQELFAQLPWRRELLRGMMGADVVGFQTRVGAANFAQVCRRFAGAEGAGEALELEGRRVRVGCFPISIDFETFNAMAMTEAVAQRREALRDQVGRPRRLLLGADRLDYTKGIDIRLQAFRELLAGGRVKPADCVLVQVAIPSREHVDEYRELRSKVERMVGAINGEFGEIGRMPVQYLHRSVDPIELSALYTAADVMLVTPLRDGMNLVSKEYVASRVDESGVLILSEFTGAAKELESALLVNPHDIDGLVRSMERAIEMPASEQAVRMAAMRERVRRWTVHAWASEFFAALEQSHVG